MQQREGGSALECALTGLALWTGPSILRPMSRAPLPPKDPAVAPTVEAIGQYLGNGWKVDNHALYAIGEVLRTGPADALLEVVKPKLPGVADTELWQLWGGAFGAGNEAWLNALWDDLVQRKDPCACAMDVLAKLNVPLGQSQGYAYLHNRLLERSQACATRLSQALADAALGQAFQGVWQGAGSLFALILEREDSNTFRFEAGGQVGSWWRCLAIVLGKLLDKDEPQRTTLLEHPGVVENMQRLVDAGARATTEDGLACGHVLVEGMDIAPRVFSQLLDLWMEAGGCWRALDNQSNPQGRAWIHSLPRVRRERLSEGLDTRSGEQRGEL